MIRTALLALLLAQEENVIRSNVVNVQVPVSVLDKKGTYVTGLTEKNFKLFDGGVAQKISVDEAGYPVSLVVAVQTSNTKDALAALREKASLLAPLITGESGEIAVISFDTQIQVVTPFTADPVEIRAGFNKLKPSIGPHPLNDAALESIRMLHARGAGRKKVVMLISEGFDEGSAVTPAEVFTQAERDNVLIYTIKMNPAKPQTGQKPKNPVPPEARGPAPMGTTRTMTTDIQNDGYGPSVNDAMKYFRGLFGDSTLTGYADFTGARAQSFSNAKSLEKAIETIGREIHSQYLLTFAPAKPEPGYHELTVQVNAPNLQVHTRRGYWFATQVEVR